MWCFYLNFRHIPNQPAHRRNGSGRRWRPKGRRQSAKAVLLGMFQVGMGENGDEQLCHFALCDGKVVVYMRVDRKPLNPLDNCHSPTSLMAIIQGRNPCSFAPSAHRWQKLHRQWRHAVQWKERVWRSMIFSRVPNLTTGPTAALKLTVQLIKYICPYAWWHESNFCCENPPLWPLPLMMACKHFQPMGARRRFVIKKVLSFSTFDRTGNW